MPEIASGNAFLVNTPNLDQLGQRLYMEGRQRELNNQRNVEMLDNEFSKNVSNIRDADVDDLTKAYQDYKAGTQALMKVKGGVSPQQQMEVLRKKAEMYKLINTSKAEREREELIGKRYSTKPDDFNDDAAELLIAGRNLPVSKKTNYTTKEGKVIDLTNPENLLYQDKINWQPILQKAAGTQTVKGKPVVKALPGGLEDEVTTYKASNNPIDFYSALVGSMNTPRASQSLATRFPFTPEEAIDIATRFEKRKGDEDFKNVYGEVKFPESSNATEGTRIAKLLTMKHYLDAPITSETKKVKNLAAVTADRQKFAQEQQARAASNSLKRLYIYAGIQNNKPLSPLDIAQGASNLIDAHIQSAKNNGGELLLDDATYEAITGKKKTRNSYITITESGEYKYGTKDETGKVATLTPVNYDLAKTKIVKEYPKISAASQGGDKTPIRTPKDIKNTKMKNNPLGLDL